MRQELTIESDTIVILRGVGINLRSTVYYYKGNIFKPLSVEGGQVGKIKRAVRDFMKANVHLVAEDRAKPTYKNLVELFDEQMGVL